MTRLIDADKLLENQYRIDDSATLSTRDVVNVEDIEDVPTVEAIPKDQYEARLKADMVAMLAELKKEIEKLRLDRPLMSRGYECYGFEDKTSTEIKEECSDIIQQKINALKGEENGKIG